MQVVDQAPAQILSNGCNPSAQAYVAVTRSLGCLFKRGVNACGNEAKLRSSGHFDGLARIMRQHEDRGVIGWLITPPAFPTVIRPFAANRTEHVSPHDPSADPVKALPGNFVINSRFSILKPVHITPNAGGEKPLHQLGPVLAQWIFEVLVQTGTVAIDGH